MLNILCETPVSLCHLHSHNYHFTQFACNRVTNYFLAKIGVAILIDCLDSYNYIADQIIQ